MQEIWKKTNVSDYYEVSNFGRVRSLPRLARNNRGEYLTKGGILKGTINGDGYQKVSLSVNGKLITKSVHRLVAEAFIPNPNNLPIINHKDENKTNNSVSNLEWCTNEYNVNYGTRNQRLSASRTGCGKKVCQYTKDWVLVKVWDNAAEASKELGVALSGISNSANGKKNSAGGFKWKYK